MSPTFRVALPGLFSCLRRPLRRGGFTPAAVWVGRAGLRLLSEPSGLPPSHLRRNYIPSSALPAPSTALRHFIRLREAPLSRTPVIYPHQRGSGRSLFWSTKVIFGRGSGGRSLLGKRGAVGVSGQQQQHPRLEMTHQGCAIPAARPPRMCCRCC